MPVPPECVVLYYHAVTADQRERFARQMNLLLRWAAPIALERIPPLEEGKRYAGVTFDDGLACVLENALPELESRSIPSTLFLTTGYFGQPASWWTNPSAPERNLGVLSADQASQVRSALVSVGSHTVNHPNLLTLGEDQARRELCESRARLAELTRSEVLLFSFPFGALNERLVQLCQEAGYRRVFSTLPRLAFRKPEEFLTGRVVVEPTDWPLEFLLKLFGAYRWLPWAFSTKRRLMRPREKAKSREHRESRPVSAN